METDGLLPDPSVEKRRWLQPPSRWSPRRVLFHLSRLGSVLGHCIERAMAYLGAGFLRRADILRETSRSWDRYSAFQVPDDDEGLKPWEETFYGRHLPSGARVLLAGCGSGRDLLGLLAKGFRTDGLELSPRCAFLARANVARRGFQSEVFEGPIEDFTTSKTYDAFVFSWYCYAYVPETKRRIEMLRRLGSRLETGGRILVALPVRSVAPRGFFARLMGLTAILSRSGFRLEPGDALDITHGIRSMKFEHVFAPGEFEREAAEAGFIVRETFESPEVRGFVLSLP